jgi:predicted nucleic acid-binding protein
MVIDASLTMTWYFDDESTAATDALLDRVSTDGAMVPGLWHLEVANAFQMAVRRQRIDEVYRDASLSELALMPITTDADTNSYAWTTTLRLAERFSLTLYDAAYLELAQRRSLPLATLDKELRAAAPALNIALLGAG